MKRRLFVGFSISNAINIISILKDLPANGWENYYVYLGNSKNLKAVCNLLKENTNIKNFYDLACNNIVLDISPQKLSNLVKEKNFNELYFQFNGADYRTISRKFKNADIFLIEDGLSSYEKHDLTFLFHKRPKALYCYNYLNNFLPHETRYSNLKYIQINAQNTKDLYQKLSQDLNIPYDKNTVILCAQELYSTGLITYEKELEMYTNCIKNLINKDIKVFFKEHPRRAIPFYPNIKKQISSELIQDFPNTIIPIEAYVSKQQPKAIISAFSTSLFLSNYLFDTPAYSLNFLKYKTQNLVLRLYDYASVIAQALFKNTANITDNTANSKQVYDKQTETLLKVKELEFYRMFISKKEFYKLKKDFLLYCSNNELLKSFNIHPVVINIIKNGNYIDLLKCNKLNIRHNSIEYFKQFNTIKTFQEFLYIIFIGLKTLSRAFF